MSAIKDIINTRQRHEPEAFTVVVHLSSGTVFEGALAPCLHTSLLKLVGPNIHPTFIRYDAIQAIEFIE